MKGAEWGHRQQSEERPGAANRSGAFLPSVVTRRQAETGGQVRSCFKLQIGQEDGNTSSRVGSASAKCAECQRQVAAGSIGTTVSRCTTYEFLTWTTRVT
jgi:hypothetical protein